MKCQSCGTANGKTNKYCRECGVRLSEAREEQAAQAQAAVEQLDEVTLGEELFDVWRLFEVGDLDAALVKGEQLARSNSESASAHSIVALIYERKAEHAAEDGRADAARALYKKAIEQYERIIDLNPDSAADREKLAALRLRIAGHPAGSLQPVKAVPMGFKAALKAIPPPALAGFVAFLIILALGIILIPGGGKKKPVPMKSAETKQDTIRMPRTTVLTKPNASAGLKVYTFPSTSPTIPQPVTPSAAARPQVAQAESSSRVEPVKLPPLGPELTLVAEPKKKPATIKPDDKPVTPAKIEELPLTATVFEQPNPEKPKPAASGGPSAASVLAQAIRLHDQSRDSEAIQTAERAVEMYQADIDAGRNPDSAKRGISNARNLIAAWRQSIVVTAE